MKRISISTVSDHVKIGQTITLENYINAIQNGKFKEKIELLRDQKRLGNLQEFNKLKRNLPAILPHGIFENRSDKNPPKKYSQLLALDVDHLKEQGIDPDRLKNKFAKDPFIVSAHLSCSGDGMVIWIKHSGDVNLHAEAVEQICDYVEYIYKVKVDQKVSKGINNQRLCSYDPDLYINWNALEFVLLPKSVFDLIQDQRNFTDNIVSYELGNRNQWLYLFVNNCTRNGISKSDLLVYAHRYLQSSDFKKEEISEMINSAYKNNIVDNKDPVLHELLKVDQVSETANGTDGNNGKEAYIRKKMLDLKAAPTFPMSLLDNLPKLIQNAAATGETQIEKDLAVLTAITGLSSLLPNVKLFYGHFHYPNIFTMILANAGEGKSKVSNVIKMLDPLHLKLVSECDNQKKKFKKAKKEFDACKECTSPPTSPSCKGIFVSEDITHAALLDKLASKSQYSLLFSTEIDSVNRTMGNDVFNKTDIFRKVYHHEMLSQSRRTDDVEIQVQNPKLSILITGTPETINGMVKGGTDGTASRFVYYGFGSGELTWKSQQSEAKEKAEVDTKKLAQTISELFEFIKDREIKFDFTDAQKLEFDKYFEEKTNLLDQETDQYYFASVKRHGLNFKRIAAILTVVEAFENSDESNELLCSDKAFRACKEIIGVLLEHSKIVFSNLEQRPYIPLQDSSEKLFQAMPDEFKPRLGYQIGKDKLGISERTVRNYYKKLIKANRLRKVGDKFQKVPIAEVAVSSAVAVDVVESESLLNNKLKF